MEVTSDGRPSAMGMFRAITLAPQGALVLSLFALAWIGGLDPGTTEVSVRWEITSPTNPEARTLFGDGRVTLFRPIDESGQCYLVSGGVLLPPMRQWAPGLDHLTIHLGVNGVPFEAAVPITREQTEGP